MHLIRYHDCKGGGFETKSRKLDVKTELMTFFHNLPTLGIMAWIVETNCQQFVVFVAWVVFLFTLFECLDLKPLPGFVQAFLPQDFMMLGMGKQKLWEMQLKLR